MLNQQNNTESQWTILSILKWTTSYLKSRNIGENRASAELLLAHALNLTRIDLYLRYDQPLDKTELARFKTLIRRRLAHEPIAYIVGQREFWSLDFAVTRDVLIPRPETECLVEAALKMFPESRKGQTCRLLELGTGSGAVVISLATERPGFCFFALDQSVRAVRLARRNAASHQVEGIIRFFCSNWFDALNSGEPLFDMIVSNPPYIPTGVIEQLQPEIRKFEPVAALDGGSDGLCSIRHIISRAHHYLVPGGTLLLEIGHDQGDSVGQISDQCGRYEQMKLMKDYSGYDRVAILIKK